MRLAAVLIAPVLLAQAPEVEDVPWRGVACTALPGPVVSAVPGPRPLRVELRNDGSLRIMGPKGIRLLRAGLPGRPGKVWRDGGHGVVDWKDGLVFPQDTVLKRGMGAWPLTKDDFRPGLEGLLWILEDGERTLTILHPAQNQMLHVRLPQAEGLDLVFFPDRLEVRGHRGQGPELENLAWAVPWKALLPQFLHLSRPGPRAPMGTATKPFPG